MATDPYRTVARESRHEGAKIKGSRFIATVAPIATPEDAAAVVARLRRELPDANHHCYAYRVGPGRDVYRAGDDGEPNGTGGRPILRRIDGLDLTDTIVVVSRIFGGTKLGVGGLVRAYGEAAAGALAAAEIRHVIPVRRVTLTFAYELSGAVQGLLTGAGVEPTASTYGESVVMRLEIPETDANAFLSRLQEATAGRVSVDPD